jgi:hypothetical protein
MECYASTGPVRCCPGGDFQSGWTILLPLGGIGCGRSGGIGVSEMAVGVFRILCRMMTVKRVTQPVLVVTVWGVSQPVLVVTVLLLCVCTRYNHLDPEIKKDAWTPDEDRLIIELHEKLGNKWAVIAKHVHGRSVSQSLDRNDDTSS